MLTHSSNAHNSWNWARTNPGAGKFFWVFHVGDRVTVLESSSPCCLPECTLTGGWNQTWNWYSTAGALIWNVDILSGTSHRAAPTLSPSPAQFLVDIWQKWWILRTALATVAFFISSALLGVKSWGLKYTLPKSYYKGFRLSLVNSPRPDLWSLTT